jgi:hypothetical protein
MEHVDTDREAFPLLSDVEAAAAPHEPDDKDEAAERMMVQAGLEKSQLKRIGRREQLARKESVIFLSPAQLLGQSAPQLTADVDSPDAAGIVVAHPEAAAALKRRCGVLYVWWCGGGGGGGGGVVVCVSLWYHVCVLFCVRPIPAHSALLVFSLPDDVECKTATTTLLIPFSFWASEDKEFPQQLARQLLSRRIRLGNEM